MSWPLWFLPSEALPLVLVGGAILVILGVMSPSKVLGLVLVLVLVPLLIPAVVELAVSVLPWWLLGLLAFALAVSLIRSLSSLVLGSRAADEMVGNLAASAVRAMLQMVFWPVRALFNAVFAR